MTHTPKKGGWFAAILSDYKPAEYWDRDAGLFYKGFKANGLDSRLLALGQPFQGQPSDLVLAALPQLEDPGWWAQWGLEGILLYTWAKPQLTGVVKAIKKAGIISVLSMDGDGLLEARQWFSRYYRIKWAYARMNGKPFVPVYALAQTWASYIKSRNRGSLDHLAHIDCLAAQSPLAKERFSRYFIGQGRPELLDKLALLEHPIGIHMRYDLSIPKERLIVAVGGWDRFVKGAPLLIKALGAALQRRPDYRARVIGPGDDLLRELASHLPAGMRNRIEITGRMRNDDIASHYQRAQILVNTSYSEGFNLAAGEALCCGCSVVGLAFMSCMNYYCADNSGTMATKRSIAFYMDALCAEMDAWSGGRRDPVRISESWTSRLHYTGVASRVVQLGRVSKQAAKQPHLR